MTRPIQDDQDHQAQDREAQRHPEGNTPDAVEFPDIGLPVGNGEPSGEQNGEQDLLE